jgi:hypothetical protein
MLWCVAGSSSLLGGTVCHGVPATKILLLVVVIRKGCDLCTGR